MAKNFQPGTKVRFQVWNQNRPNTFRSGVVVCCYETTCGNEVAEVRIPGQDRTAIYGTITMERVGA